MEQKLHGCRMKVDMVDGQLTIAVTRDGRPVTTVTGRADIDPGALFDIVLQEIDRRLP